MYVRAGFLMSVLVFVSHDFEFGRTWPAEGVDCQSRTGLIFACFLLSVNYYFKFFSYYCKLLFHH